MLFSKTCMEVIDHCLGARTRPSCLSNTLLAYVFRVEDSSGFLGYTF